MIVLSDDAEFRHDALKEELSERIEEILDRKRSSVQGREATLTAYIRILTAQYFQEDISGRETALVASFLKSIKAESSELETILALKALAITVITAPSASTSETTTSPLLRTISDTDAIPIKTAAIHALGCHIFYAESSEDEILSTLTFLLEIISSDGHYINAPDEPAPTIAALEEYAFLTTLIEDLSAETEEAIETFIDQLQSSDPGVQIAAGECIALLYEKSYTEPEENEVLSDSDEEGVTVFSDPESTPGVPKLVKRYTPYRRHDNLVHVLTSLSRLSTRSISKKDRRNLHTSFSDILNSIEHPTHGPRYQNAINGETGRRYGSRHVVRIHREGVMRIDKWWKLVRLNGLRRVLQGGFLQHYERNAVVFETLP